MADTLPKFSPWRGDPDLHNQLNRLVVKAQDALDELSAAVAKIKPAPALTVVQGAGSGGGVGAGTTNTSGVSAGTGISTSASGSGVMVTNTGVVTAIAGTGISVSGPSGNVTISAVPSATPLFVIEIKAFAASPCSIPASQNTILLASSSAGADFIANLPTATGSGIVVIVKKQDANAHNIAVTPNGTDTVDGVNSAANSTVTIQYSDVRLIDYAAGTWATW